MHAKYIKYGITRTDRAAAASTSNRPATRGHGRMRGGGSSFVWRLAGRLNPPTGEMRSVGVVGMYTYHPNLFTQEPLVAGV